MMLQVRVLASIPAVFDTRGTVVGPYGPGQRIQMHHKMVETLEKKRIVERE